LHEAAEAVDRIDGLGERACVVCRGRGYLTACPKADDGVDAAGCAACLAWSLERTLRARPSTTVQGLRELVMMARRQPDEHSWAEDEVESVGEPELVGAEDLAEEPDVDPVVGGEAIAAAYRVLAECERFVATGMSAESAAARAHIHDYLETAPRLRALHERQLLADLAVRGGGRQDERTRALFRRRELGLIVLFLLGYPTQRISAGVGLSKSQVQDFEVVREVRAFIELARNRRMRELSIDGRAFEGISAVTLEGWYGLNVRQVQRILNRPLIDAQRTRLMLAFNRRLVEQHPLILDFVHKAVFFAANPQIGAQEQRPFLFAGLPLPRTPGEPYHSWLSTNDHADLYRVLGGDIPDFRLDVEDNRATRFGEPAAWYLPGLGGVLPPGLFALLNGEVAASPLGCVR
jgi:hypothetical protein